MSTEMEVEPTTAQMFAGTAELALGNPPVPLGQLGINDIAAVEKQIGMPLSGGADGGLPWEALVTMVLVAAQKKDPDMTMEKLNDRVPLREWMDRQEEVMRHIGFIPPVDAPSPESSDEG